MARHSESAALSAVLTSHAKPLLEITCFRLCPWSLRPHRTEARQLRGKGGVPVSGCSACVASFVKDYE